MPSNAPGSSDLMGEGGKTGKADWGSIAAECGLGPDWERIGFDTAETMLTKYERTDSGAMLCPWPECSFARHDQHIEAFFRHVHSPRLHGVGRKRLLDR